MPVRDVDEPLVALDPGFGPGKALVRRELAARLQLARAALPSGIYLRVVEGYRPARQQQAIIERYSAEIRASYGDRYWALATGAALYGPVFR